jgi:hypothetical protein
MKSKKANLKEFIKTEVTPADKILLKRAMTERRKDKDNWRSKFTDEENIKLDELKDNIKKSQEEDIVLDLFSDWADQVGGKSRDRGAGVGKHSYGK